MLLERNRFKTVGMSIFAQSMKEELAAKMARVHTMMGVGLQSSDFGVNATMRRRYREEKMVSGIRMMKQHGLNFVLQVIIGLPGDSYETVASSIEFAISHAPPTIDVFRLMVLPGTEYRRRAEEFELVYSPRPYHYVVSNCSMGPAEINRAERMGQAINVFYNRPATRQEMLRQLEENQESVIVWGEAMGTFIDSFGLLDRAELRKGDLIRGKDDSQLLKILSDFRRFRAELSVRAAQDEMQRSVRAEVQSRRARAG
jgi:radical SAM superfamily enzyme YgiQ (UPF0313 family)